jgi:hypothetical protein
MKSRLKKAFYALAALAFTVSLVMLPTQKVKAAPGTLQHPQKLFFPATIVGTWSVQVQLYNCETEEPMGNPFSSFLTFDVGGTMTETTTNPVFAVGQRGPGHGIWHFDGRQGYTAKDISFVNFTTPAMPPASPGFTAGTQTISQEITFKHGPDQFTSDAKIEFADATGATYRSGCASAVGLRFK